MLDSNHKPFLERNWTIKCMLNQLFGVVMFCKPCSVLNQIITLPGYSQYSSGLYALQHHFSSQMAPIIC